MAASSELQKGDYAELLGLQSRADLNGKQVRILQWVEDKGRWAVQVVAGTKELMRVKPDNLMKVEKKPEAEAEPTDEEIGVFVNANYNGQNVAIEPGKLKKKFHSVVQKYGFADGARSDEIADFMTSGESRSVSSKEFAERFGTSVEDGEAFLAWLNVGIAFKEQYMDRSEEEKEKILAENGSSMSHLEKSLAK